MKVLVLCPHTDDGEFGCGGTISWYINQGHDVFYAALSCAEKSVPEGFPSDALSKEVQCAVRELGLPERNLLTYAFEVRTFPEKRQLVLDTLIDLRKFVKPDIVLLPSTKDTHQDHQVVSQEGFRAFKNCSILGYELPWNNITFETQAFVPLCEEDMEAKCSAIGCYKSQAFRPYANRKVIQSLLRVRGVQIGVPFAEAFEVIRWIIK